MQLFRKLARGAQWIRNQDAGWRLQIATVALVTFLLFVAVEAVVGASLANTVWLSSIFGTVGGFWLAATLTSAIKRFTRKRPG